LLGTALLNGSGSAESQKETGLGKTVMKSRGEQRFPGTM
jgi:hypothetical protein